jgi:hypothetical protein
MHGLDEELVVNEASADGGSEAKQSGILRFRGPGKGRLGSLSWLQRCHPAFLSKSMMSLDR